MSGPVHLNGGTPLDASSSNGHGDDPAYLTPLHERAFRARCEARLILYLTGNMTWQETGFPDELMPWDDVGDALPADSVLEIAIGPVEQLDNMLSHVGPEAAAMYPSIRALLVDLNDDEFRTLAHDLRSDRPNYAAWTYHEVKELARVRWRYRHGRRRGLA